MALYFAYGSNMALGQLAERCTSTRFICIARLPAYELAFTRWSTKRQCGVADIVPKDSAEVWGAIFDLSDLDLLALDRHEGANLIPPAYRRVGVDVENPDGRLLATVTYEV